MVDVPWVVVFLTGVWKVCQDFPKCLAWRHSSLVAQDKFSHLKVLVQHVLCICCFEPARWTLVLLEAVSQRGDFRAELLQECCFITHESAAMRL